jgi:uncharacterized cupredoxin-like copper-binding protein
MHTVLSTPHTPRRRFLIGLGAALSTTATWAHGPQAHGGPPPTVVREQKPWGIAGLPEQARRTITIRMLDTMRFSPDRFTVREGETVKLRVTNAGKVLHELVIGTPEELAAHAAMMQKHPGMVHDEPYMAHVDPGQKGQLVWTFNRPGTFEFACLIPGHFEAGMTGVITVTPRS